MAIRKRESVSLFAAAFGLFVGLADVQAGELEVTRIPHQGAGAEFYFAPDGKTLIGNAKLEGDETHYVYTMRIEDGEMVKINDKGEDACSHFFPDGKRLIWTSTRDLLDLPKGGYSDPNNYPQGAELYSSALDGSDVKRLTNNLVYDAEVAVSPDGKWIIWSRQVDGEIDLWRMPADGSGEEQQITFTKGEQEGGAFYLPDSETILFRSWDISSQGQRGMPMTIYTINHDGGDKKQITTEEGTNWAPYPAPDGEHFAYVKVLPPHNFEIYLRNIETGEETRLTYNDRFDGFPAISADGTMMTFSSGRQAVEGARVLHQYIMDLSSLDLGPK
jgi:Tol biopolymer transport system component